MRRVVFLIKWMGVWRSRATGQLIIYNASGPDPHLRGEELELVPDALREGLGAAGKEVALVGCHHQGAALPMI